MGKSAKVAISLPEDMLEAVEMKRKTKGESRSKFFRRAIARLLKQERESSDVKDYVHGYQEIPESVAEVEAVHQIGSAVLAKEPWE